MGIFLIDLATFILHNTTIFLLVYTSRGTTLLRNAVYSLYEYYTRNINEMINPV